MAQTLKIKTLLADLAREQGEPAAGHPSDEELVDYEAGELDPEDYRRVQDHLVACEPCARLVLELSHLEPRGLDGEDSISEHELAQSLRRMRTRLSAQPSLRAASQPAKAGGIPHWYKAVAAGLSVAVLGLAGWVGLLLSHRGGPEINAYVWNLNDTGTRGGFEESDLVEVPAGSNAVTLLLYASKLGEQGAPEYDGFRIEIAGAGRTWSRDGLLVVGSGSFSLTLPKDDFPAGAYNVRILGTRQGQQEALATYTIDLRYA